MKLRVFGICVQRYEKKITSANFFDLFEHFGVSRKWQRRGKVLFFAHQHASSRLLQPLHYLHGITQESPKNHLRITQDYLLAISVEFRWNFGRVSGSAAKETGAQRESGKDPKTLFSEKRLAYVGKKQ
ncbi:MAG: hypothetical protein SPE88_02735 [Paludibacteraceae bacterium]|nr:hypothetical protein [Paludibacteraceae bacterium]